LSEDGSGGTRQNSGSKGFLHLPPFRINEARPLTSREFLHALVVIIVHKRKPLVGLDLLLPILKSSILNTSTQYHCPFCKLQTKMYWCLLHHLLLHLMPRWSCICLPSVPNYLALKEHVLICPAKRVQLQVPPSWTKVATNSLNIEQDSADMSITLVPSAKQKRV